MQYYILPADFKKETIDGYAELNKKYKESKVLETYGNLPPGSLHGSTNSADTLPGKNTKALKKYIDYSLKNGIEFNYTLNAPSLKNKELTKTGIFKIKEFLKLLRDLNVWVITVSLPPLVEIIKAFDSRFTVKASTICSINTPNKALAFKNLGVDRLVVEEAVNRDFKTLKDIIKSFGDKIELIANTVCYNNCIYRQFHYNSNAFSSAKCNNSYKYYIPRCSQRMLNDPSTFIKNSWIRPEDVHHYRDIGIKYFKLQGRGLVKKSSPVKALEYYFKESFDGDLWQLITLFYKDDIPVVSIDNKKLDGFIDSFINNDHFCRNMCSECNYCNGYAKEAIDLKNIDQYKEYINSTKYDLFRKELSSERHC
jgi:hypothetical protein